MFNLTKLINKKVLDFHNRILIGIILGIIPLFIFAKLSDELLENELTYFDNLITNFIHLFTNQYNTKIAIFITNLGSAQVEITLLLILITYFYFKNKNKVLPLILLINLIVGWLLNELLKLIFHRSRPAIEHLVEAGGYSFPSGHAMVSTIFYGLIGYLFWYYLRKKGKNRWSIILFTVFFTTLIGLSRIYLNVHYPSDVIAGFAAGVTWLVFYICLIRHFKYI